MFGSSNKDKKPASPVSSLPSSTDKDGGQTTVIAKGTLVEGKFSCTENVRLDGAIHGEVKVEKRLVMGDTGYVQGNIVTKEAAIKGKIKGDIVVTELLHLHDSANIEGNITAKKMTVDEGARYNGTCKVGDTAAAAPSKN